MRILPDQEEQVEVPMTPMIDCVFLLLIFFLVTASMKKPHKELEIQLTPADTAKITKAMGREAVIALDGQGRQWLDGHGPLGAEEFLLRLGRIRAEDESTRIRIDLDRACPGSHVVRLVNTLNHYRFTAVGFRTKD